MSRSLRGSRETRRERDFVSGVFGEVEELRMSSKTSVMVLKKKSFQKDLERGTLKPVLRQYFRL